MGLVYAYFKAVMLLVATICILFLILERGVFGKKNRWIYFEIFFSLSGKQILHEWRHVTKHDDVWLGYKRKESTRRAGRELAFGSACSRFLSVKAEFVRNCRCLAVAAAVRRRRRWNGQLSRVSLFPSQVGSSSTKQASALTLCWVCMPAAACRPAADRLGRGYATLAYQAASISLALDS